MTTTDLRSRAGATGQHVAAPQSAPEAGWLDEDQQRLWRAWVHASTLLPDTLSHELQEKHGLSLPDYEVMVHLSEQTDHRLRMSELAERTLVSRSRLTHQVDRMERAGWVERVPCSEDRRGSWAVLTETGYAAIVAAAPTHVDGVRKHLVDLLGPAVFAQLGEASGAVAEHLVSLRQCPSEF
jgi:DNA-binding MarR family transcriptional regulator